MLHKPFDGKLRVEATRFRQSEFRLGIVPLEGRCSRQKSVDNKGPVPFVNCSSKLRNTGINAAQANLANAQVHVPEAAVWIAGT